jgi:hypothetical protein
MAADSAAKRLAAMNLAAPWRGVAVVPSGTVDASERAAALYLYSGIAGAEPPAGTGDTIIFYHHHGA